ncbi:MBL fold metallo-hydrolase [Paenibacillus qinlingensis]|uniref:L-ascorbate metabolism protein UlaG (Beta-lactamase superfamily) n=1 Tax=Paenibacillus qinlingensis TaxID=1837343 RepID=A0ABU1NRR3_9BACL|nr:MBL fold metallo-hydrolase [Paenibacillus qinlingensis]MDR6550123.1 L-ascorbate metabolism protein UlaG (beta-lactamase superfamily) [Paenibacillus qinlingensis]
MGKEHMRPIYNAGESLLKDIQRTQIPEGGVAIWSLGQAGVLIKGSSSDELICVDPYLSYSIETEDPDTEFKREIPPPLSPNELNVNSVLLTHFHNDHMDLTTIKGVAQAHPATKFVAPASHAYLLHDIEIDRSRILPARQEQVISDQSITITPVAGAHTAYESDQDGNQYYLGFFIEINGVRIYHTGDTVVTPELIEQAKKFQPHVTLLPINGGDYARTSRGIVGNMNFREAADFGVEIGSDILIPIHFDMFSKNRDNPSYFVDYLFHNYPAQKFHMMSAGERFIYFT